MTGMTFSEKVLARKAALGEVSPGQIVTVTPDFLMSHDNAAAISRTFAKMGATRVFDPGRLVIILDHCVPAASEKYAQNHKTIREFVAAQGIEHFFACHDVAGLGLLQELILSRDRVETFLEFLILGFDRFHDLYHLVLAGIIRQP